MKNSTQNQLKSHKYTFTESKSMNRRPNKIINYFNTETTETVANLPSLNHEISQKKTTNNKFKVKIKFYV